jgi:NTE family protein
MIPQPDTLPSLFPGGEAGVVLVLGGGGMKGIAHVGAWKALQEAGVRPAAVIGTSIGALIGACIAAGMDWRALTEMARALRREDIVAINRRALWLGGVREQGVLEGERFLDFLREKLPQQEYGKLELPLRINATSLVSGKEIWFGTGARQDLPLAEAVYASCALPLYFPPQRAEDDYLVDGGVLNALPVDRAREWGAGRVIGVDVGSDLLPPADDHFDKGLVAIHDRVLNFSLQRQKETRFAGWEEGRLLHIRPPVGHVDGFEFSRTNFLLEEGYRAAKEALTGEA